MGPPVTFGLTLTLILGLTIAQEQNEDNVFNGLQPLPLTRNPRQTDSDEAAFPSTSTSSFPSASQNSDSGSTIFLQGNCDFGAGSALDMCEWANLNMSAFEWRVSNGEDSFWIGGPRVDRNDNNNKGGYAFFETSQLPNSPKAQNTVSAMMASPPLESTGSEGFCVSFSYASDGLSPDKLRLLLHPVKDDDFEHADSIGDSGSSLSDLLIGLDKTKAVRENKAPSTSMDFRENTVLATIQDSTRGEWKTAQVMYSYHDIHQIIFEAIPKDETDQSRGYRGYIAVDDISFKTGSDCKGHCTFDSGFCGFTNAKGADFEWKVSRGSENPNTGPIRDHSSFTSNRVTGAFAVIDASSPRRPQDFAQIISDQFPATESNSPLCLRFWTHMFGSGIGDLNVYIRSDGSDRKVWGLSGDAGNNWYMAQAPIASPKPFSIVFEGVVGRNSLGNIAIDDVSIVPGVCPTSPQVASSSPGDCAFEDDSCGWTNPEAREAVDELNWERVEAKSDGRFPQSDHTTGSREGYYMSLSRNSVQRAGDRAFLTSLEVPGSDRPKCLSFWYYMYEPIVDNTGPNLGKLAVWVQSFDRNDNLVRNPVWRLQNGQGPSWKYAQAKIESEVDHQVIIEGVWGNNRVSGYIAIDDITFFDGDCDIVPRFAEQVKAECTFDRDSCSWRNSSTGDFEWRLATLARRPANLPDKTFGAPVGYAYFDIFNTGTRSNRVKLTSPTISGDATEDRLCFSFWFAAFGAGDTTSLKIMKKDLTEAESAENETEGDSTDSDDKKDEDDDESNNNTIWSMSAAELNTARPEWMAGQVDMATNSDFRLTLEGKATNGGFAIDQLVFSPGKCSTRPTSAIPAAKK